MWAIVTLLIAIKGKKERWIKKLEIKVKEKFQEKY